MYFTQTVPIRWEIRFMKGNKHENRIDTKIPFFLHYQLTYWWCGHWSSAPGCTLECFCSKTECDSKKTVIAISNFNWNSDKQRCSVNHARTWFAELPNGLIPKKGHSHNAKILAANYCARIAQKVSGYSVYNGREWQLCSPLLFSVRRFVLLFLSVNEYNKLKYFCAHRTRGASRYCLRSFSACPMQPTNSIFCCWYCLYALVAVVVVSIQCSAKPIMLKETGKWHLQKMSGSWRRWDANRMNLIRIERECIVYGHCH